MIVWHIEKKKSKQSKSLKIGKEFYETALPYEKMVPIKNNQLDAFWTYFNQTFESNSKSYDTDDTEGILLINNLTQIQSLKSISGSGSNYLSNEIFYRVSKMRDELKPNLPTGHLHIPLTQTTQKNKDTYIKYKYRNADKLTIDINPLIVNLISQIKEIIEKS